MLKAVFKYVFRKDACAVTHTRHRHKLGLEVGGKAGIREGFYFLHFAQVPGRLNANGILCKLDKAACFL